MAIYPKEHWLGQRLGGMKDIDLLYLFEEIADFRKTGILNGGKLRSFESEFSENVSHTPKGECMRLVEDAILFEISRRVYNKSVLNAVREHDEYSFEQAKKYMSDPNTRVFICHNNDSGKWQYSIVVENSDDFWLDAFNTLEEAEEFIKKNNLKKVNEAN